MTIPQQKTKIILSDYDYQREIENRIFLSQLNAFEVQVIQEILHLSLRFSIDQLAETLNNSSYDLPLALEKLMKTGLFRWENKTIIVDKERRKYFELQLEKFEEDFEPTLDFYQNLLNQLPIHLLPKWYAIPRSSENIIASIIDKHFQTPKIFRQYLEEIEFDDPIIKSIIKDLYRSPGFELPVKQVLEKYRLSREAFEEICLLFEYYFICCSHYKKMGENWVEILTPFAEWRAFLSFEEERKYIQTSEEITPSYEADFQYFKELKNILTRIINEEETATCQVSQKYLKRLNDLAFVLKDSKGKIIATKKGKEWSTKTFNEQIADLSSDPLYLFSDQVEFFDLVTPKNLRLIEKSIRSLLPNQWIDFEVFLSTFTAPIDNKKAISLKKQGKKWKYEIPIYDQKEKDFIKMAILERLNELGIVKTGIYEQKPCFYLTSFGHQFIH